jgi:hypothetical protein
MKLNLAVGEGGAVRLTKTYGNFAFEILMQLGLYEA